MIRVGRFVLGAVEFTAEAIAVAALTVLIGRLAGWGV